MSDGYAAFEGPGLAPLSPVPKLNRRSRQRSVEAIVNWFFENFEDPVHHAPRADGEWVYIHGGPYDTRDVVETMFSDAVSQATLEAVIEEIENEGGPEWGPSSSRIIGEEEEEEPDIRDNSFIIQALHAVMQQRLRAVEEDLDASQRARDVGIGHNHPPDHAAFDSEELRELRRAVELLKSQPVEPIVPVEAIIDAAGKLRHAATKLASYAGKLADTFLVAAAEAAGKEFGKWGTRAIIYAAAAEAVTDWLRALFGTF